MARLLHATPAVPGGARKAVVLSILALGLVSTGPGTLGEAVVALRDGVRHAGETEAAARRRLLPGYAEGIEGIRARLPLDAEYLLVEAALMRVVAFITARPVIRAILDHLALRSPGGRPPPA